MSSGRPRSGWRPGVSLRHMEPVDLLGWLAVLLTFLRLGSQPWHNLRSRQVEGLSAAAVGNNLVSDFGWLVYGLSVGLAPVWVVAVVLIPVNLLTLWIARSRIDRTAVLSTTLWSAALIGSWLVGGSPALGAVLVVSVAVILFPQVVAVLRLDRLGGLSLVTMAFALADAAAWGAYGLFTGDATLVVYGVVLAVGTGIITWRVIVTRTGPPAERPPAPRPGGAYTARP